MLGKEMMLPAKASSGTLTIDFSWHTDSYEYKVLINGVLRETVDPSTADLVIQNVKAGDVVDFREGAFIGWEDDYGAYHDVYALVGVVKTSSEYAVASFPASMTVSIHPSRRPIM